MYPAPPLEAQSLTAAEVTIVLMMMMMMMRGGIIDNKEKGEDNNVDVFSS